MGQAGKRTRHNRTITVDFQNEATYFQLLGDGKAFVELVVAFILFLGFQLTHKATCRGGGCLTRHSHYVRVRLGGVTLWRLQCTTCKAVFTILPQRLPSRIRRFNMRHPSRSHRIGSEASSPMVLTARPAVCARCFLGCVLATACATRSISSRRNSWPLRRLSARHSACGSTRCCTGRASAKAYGSLHWAR